MTEFTPIASTIGGLLIGLASILMLLFNGRIAGISGIVGGLLDPRTPDRGWRAAFVLGLLGGGALAYAWLPAQFGTGSPTALPWLVLAGLLVGFGTRLGSGCTSGHGVCGLSRLSARSLAATAIFFTAAFFTVLLVHHGRLGA